MSTTSKALVIGSDASCASLQSARNTEFINNYYSLSEEPLNLKAVGQPWFKDVYDQECPEPYSAGLVLGGTPWLGSLLRRRLDHVFLADINPAMLATAESEIEKEHCLGCGTVYYVSANWLSLPELPFALDIVTGDNCLNFLQYPRGWVHFFDKLMPVLSDSARLIIRFITIPPDHKPLNLSELVAKYLCADSIVYTQVRAHLLLSNWEANLKAIRTEHVVSIFDANVSTFEPLFQKFPNPLNDLETIRKFRNSGFVLYAPPLNELLEFLSAYFKVTGVHYGPFGLAEYFPIITAKRL